MKYNQLLKDVHDKLLQLRAIERIILSNRFQDLYEGSSDTKRAKVDWIIYQGSLSRLQKWVCYHPDLPLEECSLDQLRSRAKLRRINNYSRLYKHELIRELQQ